MRIERGVIRKKLRPEQNLRAGLIAGIVAGFIGAILWGIITVVTNYQIGYMAVAVGALVGFAMRYFGKGIDQIFGTSGAVIAVISCVLGNYFSVIGFISNYAGMSYIDSLFVVRFAEIVDIMKADFSFNDLLFYAIAGFEGYKFSFRNIDEEHIDEYEENR